jgi:hypothetical protein
MWIRETANGVEVDVEGVLQEIEARRKASTKKLKRIRDNVSVINVTDNNDQILMMMAGKYFKMVAVQESSNIEELMKEDYERQLTAEKDRLATECETTMNEFKSFAEHTLREGELEIQKLHERLRNSAPMPEIGYDHAKAGLSVVKGEAGRLMWLFHTIYAPQFLNNAPLSPAITKKMITPMIIMIQTKDDDVVGVETRTLNLDYFRHYHRHGSDSRRQTPGSDCWGQWKWHGRKVKNADEVLMIAREAANVLSNVNSGSPASRSPVGLPRLGTLASHVIRREQSVNVATPDVIRRSDAMPEQSFNPTQIRAGIDQVITNRGGWNT